MRKAAMVLFLTGNPATRVPILVNQSNAWDAPMGEK